MLEVAIATPSRKVLEGVTVPSLKLPSANGELTILPGHAALIALLGTGALSFSQDGVERRFVVSKGFAEVRDDKVNVLADFCEESTEVDLADAKADQRKAEEALATTLTDEEIHEYELKHKRAVVAQEIAGAK